MAMKSALWLVLAGCASAQPVRFANAPAVTSVDDRRDVPCPPAPREFYPDLYNFDATFHRPVVHALELHRHHLARGVNALDEVPDSTWFTNRIGTRDLTADEIRRGPLRHGNPEDHKPWTITSTKVGGTSLGLIVKDTAGEKYLIKFDMKGFPEIETASDVIVDRILWAFGFNVPEDQIVMFAPGDLVLPADAKVAGRYGGHRPFPRAELDKELASVEHLPDGKIRALASRWLDGKPLGGHPADGVRDDDPNDRIPHELRRDLRGAYSVFAWLDHLDIKEGNFLDMWTAEGDRHYVMHYLVDFGRSLGAGASFGGDLRAGFSYVIDFSEIGTSLFTLGLHDRPWEHRHAPQLRGVGLFDAASYIPGNWKPAYPAYSPLLVSDRFDQLWAARKLIAFTREQLHAAVEAGELTDPKAVEYLTDVLVARQRATARFVFAQAAPLDHFLAADGHLTFDDLALVYNLGGERTTTLYKITAFDRDGRQRGEPAELRADTSGRVTYPLVCATDHEGYTIVRIETLRPGYARTTDVHLAHDPVTHQPRVIGLERR
jgi:hypothetical protein